MLCFSLSFIYFSSSSRLYYIYVSWDSRFPINFSLRSNSTSLCVYFSSLFPNSLVIISNYLILCPIFLCYVCKSFLYLSLSSTATLNSVFICLDCILLMTQSFMLHYFTIPSGFIWEKLMTVGEGEQWAFVPVVHISLWFTVWLYYLLSVWCLEKCVLVDFEGLRRCLRSFGSASSVNHLILSLALIIIIKKIMFNLKLYSFKL